MPLGTLDRTPPPFFRQGTSAQTKLVFCAALALFLMVADLRFTIARPLRSAIAAALYYPQQVLLFPVRLTQETVSYWSGLNKALGDLDAAQRRLAQQSERAAKVEELAAENAKLRALLGLRPALTVPTHAAEILYTAADPYSRRVVIDRGQTHGVQLGAPVVNDAGVLGQVTRLYPYNAEVTMLTDKAAAIPVLNPRSQLRSVAYGGAGGGAGMELRFMAANADVITGDVLMTSGVDGVYPPGLPVARVTRVEKRGDLGFARIDLEPMAAMDDVRHVLVLDTVASVLPARADVGPPAPEPPASSARSTPRANKPAAKGAAPKKGPAP